VLAAAVITRAHWYWIIAIGGTLLLVSYIWGYSVRALKVINHPSLLNLPRRRYGEVWDALASTPELAKRAATGHGDENSLRRSAKTPVRNLIELVGVRPEDDILEFGCGVARIGFELPPRCRSWTGADLSANMLSVAEQRLRGVANVRLVKLEHVGLDQFEDNCFDLVYSTNMLDHIDGCVASGFYADRGAQEVATRNCYRDQTAYPRFSRCQPPLSIMAMRQSGDKEMTDMEPLCK